MLFESENIEYYIMNYIQDIEDNRFLMIIDFEND